MSAKVAKRSSKASHNHRAVARRKSERGPSSDRDASRTRWLATYQKAFAMASPTDLKEVQLAGAAASTTLPRSPSTPMAVEALVRMLSTPDTEGKGSDVPRTITPELLQLYKGLVSGNRVHRFTMVATTTIGSSGGGSMLQAISFSPSVVSYQEWPALSGLFDECRLRKAYMTVAPLMGSNGQNLSSTSSGFLNTNDIWVGCNHNNLTTAPSSFQAVVRQSPSYPLIRCVGDVGRHTRVSFTSPRDTDWANVTTPAVLSPPAGFVGSFDVGNASSLAAGAVYYFATLQVVAEFRCRI